MNPYAKIQTPKTAFSRARTDMLINHPFFGALAMRLKAQESQQYDTMATDGEKVYVNPEYLKTLTHDELVGLIAHEVMHVAMKHHERRANREPARWQQACDYAVNPIIIDAGLSLPKGYLDCGGMFRGKSAEEIYSLLPENGSGEKPEGDSSGSGGSQGQDGQSGPQAGSNPAPDQSGSNQSPQPYSESAPPDPGTMGQVLDRAQDAPASATGDAWENALVQAARIAEKAGKVPASVKRLVENITKPVLPWETLLERFMTKVSRDDFSWVRPNRRFIGNDLYLPSSYSEQIGHMVVAIDVSGSIRKDMLDAFISEVNGILQDVACERVTMLQCNTMLGETKVFEQGDPLTVDHIRGGGGTSFQPVFDWLFSNGSDVECLAYFTDLQVREIPPDPGTPVLWVKPDIPVRWSQEPKYGQCITVKTAEAA